MTTTKDMKLSISEASTHDVFNCLSSLPAYSKILLDNTEAKSYTEFLRWLLEKNFYNDSQEKVSLKKMAAEVNSDSVKLGRWIKQIYTAIFELNEQSPDLFQQGGLKVTLYMRYFDRACNFSVAVPLLPREFESFSFFFVNVVMDVHHFWVKRIVHEIGSETAIALEGGYLNRYREFALEKALFQGRLGLMDVVKKDSFEIDKELKTIYRD